jgi:hypothetical protein
VLVALRGLEALKQTAMAGRRYHDVPGVIRVSVHDDIIEFAVIENKVLFVIFGLRVIA